MSFFRKISQLLQLRSFLKRYPDTLIVGGPAVLAWLGNRRQSLPKSFYSQCGQDALLLSLLYSKMSTSDFPRTFVDVGCNHPVKHNNSFFFEKHMGFKVLGIDALPAHKQAWAELRPNAELLITAVGEAQGTVEFEEVAADGREGDMFSSVSGASDKAPTLGRSLRIVSVLPLTTILKTRQLTSVGIMSIDVEGYEMQALRGLDLDAISVHALVLENNSKNKLGDDEIRAFLLSKGYKYAARIWGMDDIFVLPD